MKTKFFTLCVALALAITAHAYDFMSGGLCYNITSSTTVEVTYQIFVSSISTGEQAYRNLSIADIPTTVSYGGNTYRVTSIGDYAFRYCRGLTSVTIPGSVTSIGASAFSYCSGLTSVTIPGSVTSIGDGAFSYCSGLTSVTIPSSVTSIGDYAFRYCNGLTSLTIPESVTSIGAYAFYNCWGLTSVTIPGSVTSIGASAFSGCTRLTSVTIPGSVTSIGASAFSGCTRLTSVTILEGVTSIGASAFRNCSGLTSVTIPEGVTIIGSSVFENSGLTSLVYNAINCPTASFTNLLTLDSVTIGKGVSIIPSEFISGCVNVTSLTIPESVTSIGSNAFTNTGLVSLVYNATNCPTASFANFLTLDSVTIGKGVTIIPSEFISGCVNVTSLTIPGSVTSIGDGAFYNCSGLTSVTIPGSVTSIEESAFDGCEQLTQLELPSIKTIAPYAFANCIRLSKIMFGQNLEKIGDYAFDNCGKLIRITCYATIVPLGNENSFINYNGYLYVPCDLLVDYEADLLFGKFKYIQCIAAEPSTSTTEVTIVSGATDATFTWPVSDNTQSYTLEISKDGEVFCTLRFNGNGQLLGISFAPSNGTETQNTGAALTALGYQFSVTGLNSASLYTYELKALDASNNELASYAGQFSTDGYVGIGNVEFIEGVYAQNGAIVVENETNLPVAIYDVVGRLVVSGTSSAQHFAVPHAGLYMVKVGEQIMKLLVP